MDGRKYIHVYKQHTLYENEHTNSNSLWFRMAYDILHDKTTHTHTHTHTLARSIFPTEKADAVARVAANTASFMLDGVLDIYVTKGVQGIFHLKGRCQTQKKDLEMRVSEDFHVESFNSTKAREIIYDPLSGIRYPLVIYSLGSKTALHPSFTYISHSHHQS